MELSIFAYRGSKILLCLLSLLVHLNISQTQHQNVCKKREVCSEVDYCVGGYDRMKKGDYINCNVKNGVPGICCKNIRKTSLSTRTKKTSTTKRPFYLRTTTTTLASRTSKPPRSSKNSTAVALENCRKYSQYKYVQRWKEGDLPGQPGRYHTQADCVLQETLVANGKHTSSKEFPHMALIGYRDLFENVEWNCGGSLISENFILSAAHCSKTKLGAPKWALLGDLNIATNEDDALPAVYSIIKNYPHPNYDSGTQVHDIALYQLNTTAKLGPYVRPACLYTSTFNPVLTSCKISGWGLTASTDARSDHLLKGTVSVIEDEKCKNAFPNYNTATMICAADLKDGMDTCQGDSGGPLQVSNKNEICIWDIIGVISYGHGICGSKEFPSVYTKVAVYLDWIQPIVWP